MKRRVITAVVALAATLCFPASAHADPEPGPVCGAPGLPPCAGPGPLSPDQKCAAVAWFTWTPCNWWGVQVPEGTPGSMD